MAVTIELSYFNTFALKRLASAAVPQVADPNEDWFIEESRIKGGYNNTTCLLYTSPSPRDRTRSRMPSSA